MRAVTSTHPPAEALLLQKAGRLLRMGRDRCQPWGCSGCRQRRGLVEPRCSEVRGSRLLGTDLCPRGLDNWPLMQVLCNAGRARRGCSGASSSLGARSSAVSRRLSPGGAFPAALRS